MIVEIRKAGARIGHHVAHAGHRERKWRLTETQGMNLVWVETAHRRGWIVKGDADDRLLLPA